MRTWKRRGSVLAEIVVCDTCAAPCPARGAATAPTYRFADLTGWLELILTHEPPYVEGVPSVIPTPAHVCPACIPEVVARFSAARPRAPKSSPKIPNAAPRSTP